MKIEKITFTSSKGDVINIDRVGQFRLRQRVTTSGLTSNAQTTTAYNQHGQSFINALYDPQDFDLTFSIVKNQGDYSAGRRQILRTFAPHLGIGVFSILTETGTTYYRRVSIDTAPYFPTNFEACNLKWQDVIISFTANDPRWYGQPVTLNNINTTGQQQFTVNNPGDIKCGFRCSFHMFGTSTTCTLTNVTTGQVIKFVTIDSNPHDFIVETRDGAQTVLVDNKTRWDLLDATSDFSMYLAEGDNILTLGGATTSCNITFDPRYIGI